MTQRILQPTVEERSWIADNIRRCNQLVQRFLSSPASGTRSLDDLDQAFATWLSKHDPAEEDPNPVLNAFGIAFGQHFVDDLQFSWAVVSDDNGIEIAVLGQPGNMLVFPPNFVAKRYTTRTINFFAHTFIEMTRDINRVRNSSAEPD